MYSGTQWNMDDANWTALGVQLGLMYRYSISEKLTLEVRGSLGVNSISLPHIKLIEQYSQRTVDRESLHTFAFLYSAGIGAKYHIRSNLYVPVVVDYIGCQADFKDVETTYSNPHRSSNIDNYHYFLNNINVSTGLGFAF